MNISVIIATKNRANTLQECLTRLVSQITKRDEVIVVDNNSTDTTRMSVRAFSRYHPVRYVLETRTGASYARNTGFSAATKEGVAFIDDDSFVMDGWATHLKRTLIHFKSNRHLAVFQGKMIQQYARPGAYEMLRRMEFYNDTLNLGMHARKKPYTRVMTLIVANIFAYRDVFTRVQGPFNAEVFPFIGEDVDISMRLMQQGIQLLYVPDVVVTHAKTQMTLRSACRASYLYGRAKAIHEKYYLSDTDLMFRSYMNKIAISSHDTRPGSYFGLDDALVTRVQLGWYRFWVSLWYRAGYYTHRLSFL